MDASKQTDSSPGVEVQPEWSPQPDGAKAVGDLLELFLRNSAAARFLAERLLRQTGTRLLDWIDHFAFPGEKNLRMTMLDAGFVASNAQPEIWRHPLGLFPPLVVDDLPAKRLAIKVESVADFLFVQGMADVAIEGAPLGRLRKACFAREGEYELWAVERHGESGFQFSDLSGEELPAALTHGELFRRRRRHFEHDDHGFDYTLSLIDAAKRDLGIDWACTAFFAAEREYWQGRNTAARVQKARQDAIGLGWANHDHHTYRSSRKSFPRLIEVLESLGMQCRERFYAGREAGWGAQVLEQPTAGIVVFADVDLAPEDVMADFAHQSLPERDELGTVGLWCALHGEAMLQAGMHHLECQFDFAAARVQLDRLGVSSMAPFTDFDYLKQSFTAGETWPVDPERIKRAHIAGWITANQARQFAEQGAVGSHLEVLQRDDGYKGFNQTGISEIITATDPRRQQQA